MSDFHADSRSRVANKNHKCTYCGQVIHKGDTYMYQKGYYDDEWFESKMHFECYDDLCESGDTDYMPYINERPIKETT